MNWETLIELPHIAQVSGVEASAELRGQIYGKVINQALAVLRTVAAVLLIFHDITPYLPVCINYRLVDIADNALPCLVQDVIDVREELLSCRNGLYVAHFLFFHNAAKVRLFFMRFYSAQR